MTNGQKQIDRWTDRDRRMNKRIDGWTDRDRRMHRRTERKWERCAIASGRQIPSFALFFSNSFFADFSFDLTAQRISRDWLLISLLTYFSILIIESSISFSSHFVRFSLISFQSPHILYPF